MTYADLFALLKEAKLSPENAAKTLGISNMTLRRWRKRQAHEKIDSKYVRSFRPVFEEWANEGMISKTSLKRHITKAEDSYIRPFQEVLSDIGFPSEIFGTKEKGQKALLEGLSHVGADKERQLVVNQSRRKLNTFSSLGKEWQERIKQLMAIIQSRELLSSEKMVAYGALFYLINPADLIPDGLPVIGLIDDFALLGIALYFYNRHFKHKQKETSP